jgi:uncharacterized protein YyaL (SSP411 family)
VPNRLAQESSPYLLQHQHNPVDWYPWGAEALGRAKAEDKPILVSIGYSACHWCHVMAHESFEDPETAALMNERFVNIKVDREERPDLDSLHMTAVQAMTGHGGWPLNAFLTPDGVPFFGGTYWPPEDRQGLPSFRKVLEAVSDAYRERKSEVDANAEQIKTFLERANAAVDQGGELEPSVLEGAAATLARHFDSRNGGFGGAPKFPQPSVLEFLLRRHRAGGDPVAERMVRTTLDAMAAGGVYDQIGGGFHRYAVDAVWLVPHFEKMLYDNAQLARNYLDAFRAFGDATYRRVVEETLDYVLREMTGPEGGFYATQDADSEGVEGKFYVWSEAEIDAILGPDDAAVIKRWFAVTAGGNFEGDNILSTPNSPEEVAAELGLEVDRLFEIVARARAALYEAREERVRPGRDDKVIVSWNAMMLRAFAEASRTLGRDDYRQAAIANASFLLSKLRNGRRLSHTYKDGTAKIEGFLEDYANLADALVSLYEATFDQRWFEEALALVETMIDEFADPSGIGFFDTAASSETLVARPRDQSDGATPSGNAVAAHLLLRLAFMTENVDHERRAVAILESMARPMEEQPLGFGRYLAAVESYLATPREVAIAAPKGDPAIDAFAAAVYQRFEPFAVLGHVDPAGDGITTLLPFLAHRPLQKGKPAAYLCERYSCMPPVADPAALVSLLEAGTGDVWRAF